MRRDNVAIIFSTISIAIMMLVVTIMVIFVGNHFHKSTSVSMETEASFLVQNTEPKLEKVSEVETPQPVEDENRGDIKSDGSYTITLGSTQLEGVFLSDHVDLSAEDLQMHSVSYENSYENTVPLLPSVNYEHEPISRNQVSTQNFTESVASQGQLSIQLKDSKKQEYEAFSIPEEITLYNVPEKASNSYEIATEIKGDQKLIQAIGWSSEDSSKVALSKNSGTRVTVSRASDFVGDVLVSVIVTYRENARMLGTQTLKIKVHVKEMEDSETRLYSQSGAELFEDEKGFVPATLASYHNQETFYGARRIVGWQTIEGNTYYYDESSSAITGQQVIGGLKYTFDENGVLLSGAGQRGIDVSLYQKKIDWEQVAASGISFAIIRCGFRGAATGSLVEDAYFRSNIEGAKAAGLQVGVYFYTQARNEAEATEEAIMALGLCQNYKLDLPIFVDSENMEGGRANDLDADTRTAALLAFCKTVEAAGQKAGVYASKYWLYNNVHAKSLENYSIWVAQYATECDYVGKQNYWQYSSREQIAGIEGNVDVNIVR